jgi:hypothetical protein
MSATAGARLVERAHVGRARHLEADLCIAALKSWRSSAFSMRSTRRPISSTPCARGRGLAAATARLSAVCPPRGGQERVGLLADDDLLDGLDGERLDVGSRRPSSGSVMMVAGLEFTSVTR